MISRLIVALSLLHATNASVKLSFISKLVTNPDPDVSAFNAGLKVVVPVQAGNNQTFRDVLVDTGSALLWVGGEDAYVPGSQTQTINQTFSIGYGAGGANGTAYVDRVSIGTATASQIIGAAAYRSGFKLVKPIDGILGLGPSGSNYGEVSGYNTTPTFVESLVQEGTISKPIFGIYVSSLVLGDDDAAGCAGTGEITFGGVDESRIKGDITWIQQNSPVNLHWEFNTSGLSFGDMQLANGPLFARTDTGVLTIGIPFDPFVELLHLTNGTLDKTSNIPGTLVLPSGTDITQLPPLVVGITDVLNFSIPAERYVVPNALYSALNITSDDTNVHTWIASGGPGAFMLGQKFLESAYSAYDMENHLVGFAHLL